MTYLPGIIYRKNIETEEREINAALVQNEFLAIGYEISEHAKFLEELDEKDKTQQVNIDSLDFLDEQFLFL